MCNNANPCEIHNYEKISSKGRFQWEKQNYGWATVRIVVNITINSK